MTSLSTNKFCPILRNNWSESTSDRSLLGVHSLTSDKLLYIYESLYSSLYSPSRQEKNIVIIESTSLSGFSETVYNIQNIKLVDAAML